MRSSPLRTAAVILLLLTTVTIRWWQVDKAAVPSSIMQTKGSESGMQSTPSSAAEEKGSPSVRGKRPDLPKSGMGAGLPEIQGKEIASAAVHTRIPEGHSMVTGGYQTEDGHHEFVVLTPKWLESPSGIRQIRLESRILDLDQSALVSTGLNSLVTGEKKTLQNAEVWTPEDVSRSLTDPKGLNQLSAPSLLLNPGGSAQVWIGNEKTVFTLDVVAGEAPDGGFELKSEIKRVE